MVRLCGFFCAKPMVDREDTINQGGGGGAQKKKEKF